MNDRFSADDLPRRPGSTPQRGPWPVDLAHSRPFRIGSVEVRPASREVLSGNRREVLEPLVMQVLVALASARGQILSRDDLIDACWGGRAVTDDAINRVLSRLRALARTFEGFQVETITKVGYRLVEQVDGQFPAFTDVSVVSSDERRPIDRRTLMAGGAAVAALATGAVLWRQPWRHRPSAEALDLFHRGEIAHRQGVSNQSRQAITYYEQAVRADPLYADAWGALALANTHLLEGYGEPGTEGVPERLTSAARRALDLDPDNADAQLALILLKPSFRNWATMESELRQLRERYPRHWLLLGRLAVLLYDVGRLDEGIEIHRQLHEIDAMLPVSHAYVANALLSAGRLQEAKARLDWATARWPAHPSLWDIRYRYFLYTDRPQSAAAFVMDPETRPSGLGPAKIDPMLRLATAVENRRSSDIEASVADLTSLAAPDVSSIPSCAAALALIGRADLAFQSLERYFFDRGPFGNPSPIGRLTRRYARGLFALPFAPLRTDPRFADLLRRVGLEDYWRRTGTLPDYRRS